MSKIEDLLSKYKHESLVRQDISNALLIGPFKSLYLIADRLVCQKGTTGDEQITLMGTIPVNYKNSLYDIPIQVFIHNLYPYEAPMCYVRPKPGMELRVSPAVDNNGRVYLIAIFDWKYPTCNLTFILNLLTIEFSQRLPLIWNLSLLQHTH